jgi:exopolysaccharide biosynthesis polyprenyl glycosylphosphotransferase
MNLDKRRLIKDLAKLFDLWALVVSTVIALILCSSPKGMTLAGSMAMRIKLGNCLAFGLFLLVWHNTFIFCGLYVSKRFTTQFMQLVEVCKATTLAAGILFASAIAFHLRIVRPEFVLGFWFSSTCLMAGGRIVARWLLLGLRSRGKNTRYILIVGTNERAIEFVRQIGGHPELGYHVIGFVDDDWAGTQVFESTGYARCCTFAGLADFFRLNVIDEAAIYLPLRSYYEHAAELVSLCEQHGVVIRFDSQVFKLRNVQPRGQDLDLVETSRVFAAAGSAELLPAMIKRTLDCLCSAALLVWLAPVLLVTAVLVKLTSRGPIVFSQIRVGLNKRQFKIYKFRTMVANAEQLQDQLIGMNEMSGPVFKIKRDPRVTPLGRILRKTSIDELPQLFNVLRGDMSLVGPRAMSLRDYRLFDQDWQRRRFSVKPGITCLWQVCGRSALPFDKWMELDMQYIDKWSLWLDLKILAQTVPAVLRGTGAA